MSNSNNYPAIGSNRSVVSSEKSQGSSGGRKTFDESEEKHIGGTESKWLCQNSH